MTSDNAGELGRSTNLAIPISRPKEEGTWALLDIAAAAVKARRHGEAAQLANQAHTAAAAVGARPLADAAAQFLASLHHGRSAPPWHPLSDREFEIALLIAEGLTNKQIAEQLVVAPKTMENFSETFLQPVNDEIVVPAADGAEAFVGAGDIAAVAAYRDTDREQWIAAMVSTSVPADRTGLEVTERREPPS